MVETNCFLVTCVLLLFVFHGVSTTYIASAHLVTLTGKY